MTAAHDFSLLIGVAYHATKTPVLPTTSNAPSPSREPSPDETRAGHTRRRLPR